VEVDPGRPGRRRSRRYEGSPPRASARQIAKRVFGDARYHGRVERVLRAESAEAAATPAPEPHGVDRHGREAGDLPTIRELLDRHRKRLAAAEDLPSLKEIELLMKLERQLDAAETVAGLNELTRHP
jgi:DNA-directed RNA polymerase specialized sigma24 family protein